MFITIINLGFSVAIHYLLRFKQKAMEESGEITEDERMFEPFYGAKLVERWGVIASVALLGSLPLLVASLVFENLSTPWYGIIIGGLGGLLQLIVGLYAVILFKKIRDYYNRHELTILPVVVFIITMGFIYYVLALGDIASPVGVGSGQITVIVYSLFAITAGEKLLLNANRTIFDKKARAEDELQFASEVQQQFLKDRSVGSEHAESF